jgi:NAD(P)H-quinone oxidoreductase subunit 5
VDAPWSSLAPLAALGVPATLAFAGVTAPRRAAAASATAVVLAAGFALVTSVFDAGSALGVRVDVATRVMLLLVATLGAVVARFSGAYLEGERELVRYDRWLLLTTSAVTALVVSDSLLVIAVCWTATSLALHQLLTFYADRPAALVAAHKKFIVSRLADVALLLALGLVYENVGSFDLERVGGWVDLQRELPLSMHVAACLLVATVALRSAQLPFHGWITQVMEAPTPVSALLHAGVVNIGGFVLIRISGLMNDSDPARLMLVAVGLATAIIAALVMTTRVSVKVALAWSTCAQMGFLLVQCGLGLWSLALLHIVAHSLYKAYAFLAAGTAVEEWKVGTFAAKSPLPSRARLGLSLVTALGVALSLSFVVRPALGLPESQVDAAIVMAIVLGLSLVPLVARNPPASATGAARAALYAACVAVAYVAMHASAEHVFPSEGGGATTIGLWMTAIGFAGLFGLRTVLQRRPQGSLARRLHPWLFAGLYLDEFFTKLTFRLWPPRRPRAPRTLPRVVRAQTTAQVQS